MFLWHVNELFAACRRQGFAVLNPLFRFRCALSGCLRHRQIMLNSSNVVEMLVEVVQVLENYLTSPPLPIASKMTHTNDLMPKDGMRRVGWEETCPIWILIPPRIVV